MRLKKQSGFTLIELVLYLGLISIFLTGVVSLAWDVVYGRQKLKVMTEVEQEARLIQTKIGAEIQGALLVSSVSADSISLSTVSGSVVIARAGNQVTRSVGGSPAQSLNSNLVEVIGLVFTDLSVSANSSLVQVELTVRQDEQLTRGKRFETSLTSSFEPNGPFNQGRKLLIDGSGANFDNQDQLEGVTLENVGAEDLEIARLAVSWSGTAGGERLTEVQIDGGTIEWSGGRGSDLALFDLTNSYTLLAGGLVELTYLDFDDDLSGGEVLIVFGLADGSAASVLIAVGEGSIDPNPTPTPDPTPTPTLSPTPTPVITSCSGFCQNLGYSGGICRTSPNQCSRRGETNEVGGDGYCLGGNDTCCCQP